MFIPIMHALGFEDARQWCLARGIRADLARLVSLSFQGGSSNCLEIPLPREATRSMALAYILRAYGWRKARHDLSMRREHTSSTNTSEWKHTRCFPRRWSLNGRTFVVP